jgi:hypothetical protein
MVHCTEARNVIHHLGNLLKPWSELDKQVASYQMLINNQVIGEKHPPKVIVDKNFTLVKMIWEIVLPLFPKELCEKGWKGEY